VFFAFALGLLAAATAALLKQSGWGSVVGLGLFGGFVLWIALTELATLHIQDRALLLWGPFRRQRIDSDACAFGVRLQSGSRSVRYIVFATDGQTSIEVGNFATERGARRSIGRLSETLYGDVPRRGSDRAQREIEQVERTWKANRTEAQNTIDAYYKSPGWRAGKYIVIGVVVAYSIGMSLYLYFSGIGS
jgi:hypothetical protein